MNISALSIQEIVAVIRQQATSPVDRSSSQAAPVTSGTMRKTGGAKPGTKSGQQSSLGRLIAKRMRSIDKTDPDRGRKAFRIFLESVLLNEFGAQLINDPGFYQMVDDIQARMEGNPQIAAVIQQAIDKFLGSSASDAGT